MFPFPFRPYKPFRDCDEDDYYRYIACIEATRNRADPVQVTRLTSWAPGLCVPASRWVCL